MKPAKMDYFLQMKERKAAFDQSLISVTMKLLPAAY